MKNLLPIFFFSIIFYCCGNKETSKENNISTEQNSKIEPKAEFKPVTDVTYDQLIGIWEIKEIRKDPNVSGEKPGMMDKGILFGFNKKGMLSTTSLGLEYFKGIWKEMGMLVKVNNGEICSADSSQIFKEQWGGCIPVFLINKNELVLKYDLLSKSVTDDVEFKYLKRVE